METPLPTANVRKELNWRSDEWREFYDVDVACGNCGERQRLYIRKGVTVKAAAIICAKCKNPV